MNLKKYCVLISMLVFCISTYALDSTDDKSLCPHCSVTPYDHNGSLDVVHPQNRQRIENNDLESLKRLLRIEDGKIKVIYQLPLVMRESSPDLIRQLIQKEKISLDEIRLSRGRTLLHLAAAGGNIEMVRFLVEEIGLDPSEQDDYGQTPLHEAVKSDSPRETISYLLQQKDIEIDARDDYYGGSPLIIAIDKRNPEAVACLLESGADFLSETKRHGNALSYAVMRGDKETKALLLQAAKESGIKSLKKDKESIEAILFMAICLDDLETVSLVIENCMSRIKRGYDQRLLRCALEEAGVSIVSYFMEEHDMELDLELDQEKINELQFAARYNQLDTVKYLIERHGLDPLETVTPGSEPFGYAISQNENEATLKFFIEEYGDGLKINFDELLISAARRGSISQIKYLIEQQGADPSAEEDGHNIFYYASKNLNRETHDFCVLRYLLHCYKPTGWERVSDLLETYRHIRVFSGPNKSSSEIQAVDDFRAAVADLEFSR